jgi:hypothetical protein
MSSSFHSPPSPPRFGESAQHACRDAHVHFFLFTMISKSIATFFIVGGIISCGAEVQFPALDVSLCSVEKSVGTCSDPQQILESAILDDIRSAMIGNTNVEVNDLCVPSRGLEDVNSAMRDFSPGSDDKGRLAWNFLRGLANSETFVQDYWHKRPLLIRAAETGGWVEGSFTVEKDLRLIDNSYITGYKTAEIIRNGTKTDTWELSPLKDNPAQKTTWNDVADAIDGGTIYFNTAGSFWPNLGGLCRLTSFAFGLPPNVNVYVTPPGKKLSLLTTTVRANYTGRRSLWSLIVLVHMNRMHSKCASPHRQTGCNCIPNSGSQAVESLCTTTTVQRPRSFGQRKSRGCA